jgi:CheY-like chemotaxis protein
MGELPEVIVSDLAMPEVDGFEFGRRVRALSTITRRIPMIALTACAEADDRLKALSAGFQAYVSKPVELEKLTLAIAEVLGRQTEGEASVVS